MKKFFNYLLAVVASAAALSCSQGFEEQEITPDVSERLVPMTITVDGEATRTFVGEDGKSICWHEDDKIAIFEGTLSSNKTIREFTIVPGSVSEDGKTATFTGEVEENSTKFYAIYPFKSVIERSSGTTFNVNMPAIQTLEDGNNVADGAIVSLGYFTSDQTSFNLSTVVGFLSVDITFEDVTSVEVCGTEIAGTTKFSKSTTSLPKVSDVLEAENTVTLLPEGEVFTPGTYYIALLPSTTPAGEFSIDFKRQSGITTLYISAKDIVIERNKGFKTTDSKWEKAAFGKITDAQTLVAFLEGAANIGDAEFGCDIDLQGVELPTATSFLGTLDCKGFALKNWNATAPLFENLAGTVKDLTIDSSCTLTPADAKGAFGFVARTVATTGALENITNNAAAITLNATAYGAGSDQTTDAVYFGTLAGQCYGKITGCTNNCDITIATTPTGDDERGVVYIGGLAGLADNDVQNCHNTGDISYTINGRGGYLYIGGVAGGTTANKAADIESSVMSIDSCTNSGNIYYTFTQEIIGSGNANSNYVNMAGVIGYCEGSVTKCVNGVQGDNTKGKVQIAAPTLATGEGYSAAGVSVAGVTCYAYDLASECTNYGTIDVDGSFGPGYETYAGGGNCEDGGTFVAGVIAQIGACGDAVATHSLENCHNYGVLDVNMPITSTSGTNYKNYHYVGGVVAYANAVATNITNNATIIVYSEGTMNYLGGVIGLTECNATTITNNGVINYTIGRTGGQQINNANQFFGGVIGYNTGDTMSSLTNNNNVTLTVKGTNQKLRFGGVAGSIGNATTLVNNGAVTLNDTVAHAKEIDLGGVAGASTSGTMNGATNSGNVSYSGVNSTGSLYIAGVVGYSASTSSENFTNNNPISVKAIEFGTLYTAGISGSASGAMTTASNTKSVSVECPTITTLYLAGVSGAARSATTYTNADNSGSLSASAGKTTYVAGIAGHSGGKVEFYNCDNSGAINFIASELEATEISVAGVCARPYAKSVYNNCTNSGALNVTAKSASKACYLGGIAAQISNATSAGNGCDVENCTVSGDIIINCPAVCYVGGAIAYGSQWSSTASNHRVASGNTVECDITISSSTTEHHVGGIIGHSGIHTDITSNSYKGTITTDANNAAKLSNVGGIIGTCVIKQASSTAQNATFALSENSVEAEIMYDAASYGALLVGAVNNLGTKNTSSIICEFDKNTIKSGSKVNGVSVTAENYLSYLMSNYDYTGVYTLTVNGKDTTIFE